MTQHTTLAPPEVRYIKLGKAAAFAEDTIARGVLPLAFAEADHGLCAEGAWDALEASLVEQGRGARPRRRTCAS